MGLTIGLGGSGGSGGKVIRVPDKYIFADAAARDAYFVANPAELIEDLYVVTGGSLQQWRSGSWVNVMFVFKGDRGDKGDSAFILWLNEGNTGTVEDFLNDISDRRVKLFVQKNGINGAPLPVRFPYNEKLAVSDVVLSTTAAEATFEIGGAQFDSATVIGQDVPVGTDFVVRDIDIKAGQDSGSVLIIF